MRIKTSWVALSVVVLAAGLLLVASLWHSLFSGGRQQSVVPERSPPPGTSVSAQPTASPLATATPSPAPTAPAPSARPAPMPLGQPGPPPTAAVPSAPGNALPTTRPAPPPPTVEPTTGAGAEAMTGDGNGEMTFARAGRSSVILPGVRRLRFGSRIRSTPAAARWSPLSAPSVMLAPITSSSANPTGP